MTGLSAPALTIRSTPTHSVVLSWPSPSAGFTLQENADLSTANWAAASQSATDDGTNITVIVNPAIGKRFYRLWNP